MALPASPASSAFPAVERAAAPWRGFEHPLDRCCPAELPAGLSAGESNAETTAHPEFPGRMERRSEELGVWGWDVSCDKTLQEFTAGTALAQLLLCVFPSPTLWVQPLGSSRGSFPAGSNSRAFPSSSNPRRKRCCKE